MQRLWRQCRPRILPRLAHRAVLLDQLLNETPRLDRSKGVTVTVVDPKEQKDG